MTKPTANPLDRLDPELALRPGDFDAQTVLFLWCIRKSFWPTVWLGLSVAFIAYGDPDAVGASLDAFDSPQAMFSSLLSPLGVLVAAFGIKIGANLLALAAAYPLTRGTTRHHYVRGNRVSRFFHLWWDRLYQARAYRSLRLTWGVREAAYTRLDTTGRFFKITEFVLSWANVVLLIAMFVVMAYVGGKAAS